MLTPDAKRDRTKGATHHDDGCVVILQRPRARRRAEVVRVTLAIDDAYGLLDTVLDDCARAYALVTLEPTVRTDLDELRDHALDAFQAARRVRAWLRPGGGQET